MGLMGTTGLWLKQFSEFLMQTNANVGIGTRKQICWICFEKFLRKT